MWFDASGKQLLPSPLFPSSDTLGQLELHPFNRPRLFVGSTSTTQSIIKKEFALSGSEQNPDLTGKSWLMTARRATSKGAPAAVRNLQDPRRRLLHRARQPR